MASQLMVERYWGRIANIVFIGIQSLFLYEEKRPTYSYSLTFSLPTGDFLHQAIAEKDNERNNAAARQYKRAVHCFLSTFHSGVFDTPLISYISIKEISLRQRMANTMPPACHFATIKEQPSLSIFGYNPRPFVPVHLQPHSG